MIVRLPGGVKFEVEADITEFARALKKAMDSHELIEITTTGGVTRLVNPFQVLYIGET